MADGRIEFLEKSGFTNPYGHLLKSVSQNDSNVLLDAYWEAKARVLGQSPMTKFYELKKKEDGDDVPSITLLLSRKDLELLDWNEFIVKKNQPISIVEDDFWRKKIEYEHTFSKKTVTAVMIGMCADIKELLSFEMKAAGKGSILHDG